VLSVRSDAGLRRARRLSATAPLVRVGGVAPAFEKVTNCSAVRFRGVVCPLTLTVPKNPDSRTSKCDGKTSGKKDPKPPGKTPKNAYPPQKCDSSFANSDTSRRVTSSLVTSSRGVSYSLTVRRSKRCGARGRAAAVRDTVCLVNDERFQRRGRVEACVEEGERWLGGAPRLDDNAQI